MVNAMTEVMTGLAPKYQRTVQLRFINKDETSSDLQPSEILGKLNFKPNGGTKIGTVLNDKVLKPFVKDVIDGGRVLDRPYLVIAITDGHPESEDTGKFRSVVSEYRDYITSNGYSKHGKNCQPRILQENSLFSKLYHSPLHQPQPDRE